MLLAIDLGNTEVTVGGFVGDDLAVHWRLTASQARTPDEWAATLSSLFEQAGHSARDVKASAVASVAPHATRSLVDGIERATGGSPMLLGPESELSITLDVDEPMTVGADRVVNVLAAVELYDRDVIVVDFGTATTFDCIMHDRRFIGGVIMPGVASMSEDLVRRTAKLPATELEPPPSVIGRRTDLCIRSGILFGGADAVDGLITRIKAEWPGGGEPRVVATGGLAGQLVPLCRHIDEVQPTLTLIGIRLAARVLGATW